MKNFVFLILFLLVAFSGVTRADVIQSPSGIGSCTIPDNSTLTNISVLASSNPLWNPFTSCTYSFSGGTGWTLAVANDVEYGELDFTVPVDNLVYDFDYSYWFMGPGTLTMDLPSNPNGEGFISGLVSSIYWMSPANDSLNYNGIINFSFSDPSDSVVVPESSTLLLALVGLGLLCWTSKTRMAQIKE